MFDYNKAFSRNIGLVSLKEQEKIKNFTIAIPGMGWVGSNHLIALVRQWFQNFKIADFDEYEIHNFNRQYWATMNTLDQNKAETMKQKALEINPNCNIEVFLEWINKKNINHFLENVDLAIDWLDFFVLEERRMYYNKAHELKIPLITSGPMGYSAASLIFMPDGPNFDQYFNVNEHSSYKDLMLHFWLWLAPSLLHMSYMKNVSLENKSGPSSIAAVNLCAWFITTNALKILLNWWQIKAVPHYHQYDLMKNKYVCKKLFFWLNSPWQKIKLKIAIKMMGKKS